MTISRRMEARNSVKPAPPYLRASVRKRTSRAPGFAKLKAPLYAAAGQVESRFFRRFTPAIVQKPEEAQTPLKESYKRQQTPASAA